MFGEPVELGMTLQEFVNDVRFNAETFALVFTDDKRRLTYADWFDMFRDWSKVGNDMEMEYYGPRLKVHSNE